MNKDHVPDIQHLPSPYTDEKFTPEELQRLFPTGWVPLSLSKIMFPEISSPLTVGEIREIAHAMSVMHGMKYTRMPGETEADYIARLLRMAGQA